MVRVDDEYPVNTWRWPNAGLMFGQRLRRCPNIKPALGHALSFTPDEEKQ